MQIDFAKPQESEELSHFFNNFTLQNVLELRLQRGRDFFAPYRLQSSDFKTLTLRSPGGELQGIASFVFRKGLVDGEIRRFAFATDLRVAQNRGAILHWSQNFLPVLKDMINQQGASTVLSFINTKDSVAMNALVRPRQLKRPLPRYYLYRPVRLVAINGAFPWAKKRVPTLLIEPGSEAIKKEILQYLQHRAQYRAFSSAWDLPSLEEKVARLPGFEWRHFLLARNAESEAICGCLATWNGESVQRIVPLHYSLQAHNYRQFLKFARFLGWTKPLTKPTSRTGEEQALHFRYLLFLNADNEDIFESLLTEAFTTIERDEFLLYAHCADDVRLRPPPGWIAASLPFGLYSVMPPEAPLPYFLHPSYGFNPEVEAPYFL